MSKARNRELPETPAKWIGTRRVRLKFLINRLFEMRRENYSAAAKKDAVDNGGGFEWRIQVSFVTPIPEPRTLYEKTRSWTVHRSFFLSDSTSGDESFRGSCSIVYTPDSGPARRMGDQRRPDALI
jgi:hypothetical protein